MTASNLSDRFLFGRSQVLRQVVGSKVGLTLLVGDSGIGKSEILGHAQTTTETMLAPPPVEVFSRDGAIVEAVCESLALALAFAATEPGHEAQLRLVREYIQELAKRSGSFVAQVAKEALLHQLTLRLGDRVVELGKNLAAEIVKSGDGLLAARVGDFRSADVMSELASLASEVRDLSGREVLSIAVDRLEILPEADVRLLADVAPRLPEGIVIKAALLDTTSAGAAALQLVRQVAGDAVAVISVEPLGELTVREILEASELDPAAAPDVLRLTGGYPLHIGDLVRHIATGGQVNRATTNDDFGQLIKARWDGLPLECRQVARQLCVLERPLPTDSLIATLGIQVAAWWDIVETLRTERILTQTVDGLPWFHEQRRRWLVDRLPDEERRATASRMLPAVCEVALGASGWRYCTTLSALI